MPLNKPIALLCLVLFLTNASAQAQKGDNVKTVVVTSKGERKSANRDDDSISSNDARKQIMSLFNLFRGYSVSVDTVLTKTMDEDADSYVIKGSSPTYFKTYLSKMDATIRNRIEFPEVINNILEQKRLNKSLVLLKSAECFGGKEQGVFKLTKDQEGNEIIAFPLDSLRKKSRYGLVDNYTEGYARIQKDQVFGFLNLCGEEVITCQYEKAEPFNYGMALVRRMDWMFIDTKGKESAPLEQVADAHSLGFGITQLRFTNNMQALVNNEYGTTKALLSALYESIEPFNKQDDVLKVRNGKKYGIIGLNGKTKLDPIYDEISATNIPNIYRINLGKRIGLVDSNWQIQFPPSFNIISDFNEFGIATAVTENSSILIHKNGLTQSGTYESISVFNDFGIAIIRDANKNYGLIDTNFRVISEPKYASIGSFNDIGLAPACLTTNKCGFIKYDGTEQIKANYESVGNFNASGLAIAKVNVTNYKGKRNETVTAQIVIDTLGNTIIPVTDEAIEKKFIYVLGDTLHCDEYLVVHAYEEKSRYDLSYYLIRKSNNQLITSTPYQTITSVDICGNMRVKKDNLWGLLDTAGKVLAKGQFSQIQRVSEKLYAVQNETGKWGFVDYQGKQQIPYDYDEVRSFRNGYVVASKGKGKWGLINRFNAKVVPCIFKSIAEKGRKYEITDQEGLIYIINDEGECETNCPKFEAIRAEANKTVKLLQQKK